MIGRVTESPYLTGSKQIVEVGQIRVLKDQFPEVVYGDKIEVFGKLEPKVTKKLINEYWLYSEKIAIVDRGKAATFWIKSVRLLVGFRRSLENRLSLILPEPESSLLSGILLGTRSTISKDFLQDLQTTGVVHLIAASGYNIAVVAGAVLFFFSSFLMRKRALILSFLAIILYTLMAGAGPAVVRAAIMGSLTYLAQLYGREKEAVRALAISAYLMLFIKPLILFDIGFQLSFSATAGILFTLPIFDKITFFQKNSFGKEISLTLAAQTGVLPIVLYHFQSVSLLSPAVNVMVAPLVPYIMSFGALTAITGLLFTPLGRLVSLPVWVLLTTMVKLISFFGRLSWANFKITSLPLWLVLIYYFVLVMMLIYIRHRELNKN